MLFSEDYFNQSGIKEKKERLNMALRYKYDFMMFPEQGAQDFELVVRAGEKIYEVYKMKIQMYPDSAALYLYNIDLNQFSQEDLDYWVSHWGYKSYPDFIDYLENKTPVKNNELRLCSCIVQNDNFLEPQIALDADIFACIDFLTEKIGRSPYDDSDN